MCLMHVWLLQLQVFMLVDSEVYSAILLNDSNTCNMGLT